MVVIRAGIKKMLVRIANREEPDLTVSSDLGLPCLPRPFYKATSVGNFRTYTVNYQEQWQYLLIVSR